MSVVGPWAEVSLWAVLSMAAGVVVGWRIGGTRLTREERRLATLMFSKPPIALSPPTFTELRDPEWLS